MVTTLRITSVDPDNVADACRLAVRPDQEDYVAPVAFSLAEAYANPRTAWPRLVYDGDQLVGFIMGGFDPDSPVEFFRCGIWRLNVAADQQGKGVRAVPGRGAVRRGPKPGAAAGDGPLEARPPQRRRGTGGGAGVR